VPQHAYTESARQLAQRWISESRLGINGTGVFPGFIKTGVDSGPLSEIDAKLVRAAAIAHHQTGLPIAIHTGDEIACQQYLTIVKEEGVSLEAVIIVHAGNVKDTSILIDAAREGAWIELDNIAPNTIEEVINQVLVLKSAGVLHKVMLSHDAGWYHVGEQNGGNFRPFTDLAKEGFPAMKKQGFTDREIRQLTQTNPQKAFTIGIHMRSALK
jgi:phosphotriesterase-related protein